MNFLLLMADDQNIKPKTMDIDDLVRELSKSSTAPVAPTPKPPMTSPMTNPAPVSPRPPSPPASGPMVPSPIKPPMPKPQFNVPPPVFTPPKPAPIPATPPASGSTPSPTAPGVKEYQSSIRTMNEDISKIKQGQQPAGVPIPRKVEQITPQASQSVPPKPTMPSQQFKVPSVNLGEIQKSGPMAQSKDIPKPPVAPKIESKPQIYVPQEGQTGGNHNMLFMAIGAVAILAGFAYWFFVLRSSVPEIVIESPTPTPTEIPTPTPFPPEKLGITEKISIPSTSVFLSSLTTEMNARQPIAGQIRLYDIVDENQQKYSFKEFLAKLLIDTSTLNDSGLLDTREWVIGLYGQIGTDQNSSGRPFIVLKQNESNLATNLMSTWEPRIINDLAKLFDLSKFSSKLSFTSDTYSNINFRFVRIPDRDLGVAYAIFQNYLVIGSSRDSFRATLDALVTP